MTIIHYVTLDIKHPLQIYLPTWPSHCLLVRMSTPKIPIFITLLELLISIIGVDNHIKGVDIPSPNHLKYL